jgi:hypothetical protein
MGHNAVCQVGCHSFFYEYGVGLESVYRAIAPRQKYFEDNLASGGTVRGASAACTALAGIGESANLGQNRGAKILERREQI